MAVPEQTPYIEHTGNGVTTSFSLGFQCETKGHLIVLIDDIEPPIATWSLTGGNVVFTTAPASGSKITLQRNTPFSRTTDYQSYNNSFRPSAVNKDFDWIWLKLQELGVADWILSNRINDLRTYVDKQDNVLQDNIDSLKNYVDDKDDELRNYLLNAIQEQGVALDQLEEYYSYLMQQLAQVAIDRGWAASFIVSADGSTQQEINDFGGAKWRNKPLGYDIGSTVKLDNGDIVKSTIDGNTNDPNVDMSGWFLIGSNNITTVESIADLANLENWGGRTVYVDTVGQLKYSNDGEWERDIILANVLNLLDFIPIALHQFLTDFNDARNNAIDVYPYILKCINFAERLKKSIYIPSGYYPVSQTVNHPNYVNVLGDYGKTWIIPSKTFPEFSWLWDMTKTGMAGNQLNGVSFQGNDWNYQKPYFGGLKVSGRAWFCCVKNIRFLNLNYGGFLIAPRYILGEAGVPDLVNLNIENIFFLDCGSVQYFPAFDIDLRDESDTVLAGNWTDGSIKNIDIATADGDQVNTRGPIGFRIEAPSKTIFNVAFDRFFIGTRLQTHVYIDAKNLNGNTFSNFSGETHSVIYNGKTMADVEDYTYQLHFEDAGQWNNFININGNMSLGDLSAKQRGMFLNKSYSNIFNNMPLNASFSNIQLELLHLTPNARLTTFENCNVRLIDDKNWNLAWNIANNLFTITIVDNGVNTKFNGPQVQTNAIKERALSYYTTLNADNTAPANSATGTGLSGLTFLQNQLTKALIVKLAASQTNRQLNFFYYNLRPRKNVYYVIIKITQSSGSLDNYIEVGMFDQSHKCYTNALNVQREFVFVFNNTGSGVDALVLAFGNNAATSSESVFSVDDIYVSSNALPYKPNCMIVAEA